jgi:hypothetical protein
LRVEVDLEKPLDIPDCLPSKETLIIQTIAADGVIDEWELMLT